MGGSRSIACARANCSGTTGNPWYRLLWTVRATLSQAALRKVQTGDSGLGNGAIRAAMCPLPEIHGKLVYIVYKKVCQLIRCGQNNRRNSGLRKLLTPVAVGLMSFPQAFQQLWKNCVASCLQAKYNGTKWAGQTVFLRQDPAKVCPRRPLWHPRLPPCRYTPCFPFHSLPTCLLRRDL
jgi:hypothetical protein